ncbi:hypothetical protein Tco_0692545 [Tanacetum coccineum]
MSSITAQQAKLDLELVPKEKRLEIRKCNGRLNPGKIQREPTFQVVLDALALTPCYSAFLITADVPEVYMRQFWDSVYKHDTFYRFKMDKRKRFKPTMEIFRDIFKICPRVQGQDFDALYTDEEIMSFLRDLGHTREIHSLNDVVVDQMHQPWRTLLLSLTEAYLERHLVLKNFVSSEHKSFGRNKIGMHTSRDDYLINTLRFVSVKEETQIYGAILLESLTSPEMKETKSYKTYFETPERPLSKKKEKVDVTQGKGIELLSQVALNEDAQFKEGNDVDDRNNEQDSIGEENDQKNDSDDDKTQSDNENESDSKHKTDENESGSEFDQDGNEEDEEEVKDELVKTPSNDSDDEDETKITDKVEGDEDEEIDYTTSQLYDDVDMWLNEPVDSDKGFVQ